MIEGFIVEIRADLVLLETKHKEKIEIARKRVPRSAVVGDFIRELADSNLYEIDYKITQARLRMIKNLTETHFN